MARAPHCDHGDSHPAGHQLGEASTEEPCQASAAMLAQHDEVDFPILGNSDDFLKGLPDYDQRPKAIVR